VATLLFRESSNTTFSNLEKSFIRCIIFSAVMNSIYRVGVPFFPSQVSNDDDTSESYFVHRDYMWSV